MTTIELRSFSRIRSDEIKFLAVFVHESVGLHAHVEIAARPSKSGMGMRSALKPYRMTYGSNIHAHLCSDESLRCVTFTHAECACEQPEG